MRTKVGIWVNIYLFAMIFVLDIRGFFSSMVDILSSKQGGVYPILASSTYVGRDYYLQESDLLYSLYFYPSINGVLCH